MLREWYHSYFVLTGKEKVCDDIMRALKEKWNMMYQILTPNLLSDANTLWIKRKWNIIKNILEDTTIKHDKEWEINWCDVWLLSRWGWISPSSSDGKSDTDPFSRSVFVSYKKWLWFSHIFITFATSPWLITSGNITLLAAIALNAI